MPVNKEFYLQLRSELNKRHVTLVAVSKTKPVTDIFELYEMGHRDFGENYVQELAEKVAGLPLDIRWHFIGHLQTNKVKFIAPYIFMIHGVDSFRLLKEINKQAEKNNRVINCLLQVHIAKEETKFGLSETELIEVVGQLHREPLPFVNVRGLMGMASFTGDPVVIRNELRLLKQLFEQCRVNYLSSFDTLSMGMSGDYAIAVEEGSTLVRVGSLVFGERSYTEK